MTAVEYNSKQKRVHSKFLLSRIVLYSNVLVHFLCIFFIQMCKIYDSHSCLLTNLLYLCNRK